MLVNPRELEPNLRNHKRVLFIRGLYKTWYEVNTFYKQYESSGTISHHLVDDLLERHVRRLKDLAHDLYRTPENEHIEHKRQRLFDRLLGELWHELDKMRDNIRLLESYQLEEAHYINDDKMLLSLYRLDSQVIGNARRELPKLVRRIKRFINKLIPLFEQILPLYRDNIVVLRTLYFSRHEFEYIIQQSVPHYFFPRIFASVEEGFQTLIHSLIETRHLAEARHALAEFESVRDAQPEIIRQLDQSLRMAEEPR